MRIPFSKYQGTGNDFVIIDQTATPYVDRTGADLIARLCDRRYGIGADGLILIEKDHSSAAFRMVYFNSDGRESSMCGNGGRCAAAFASRQGIVTEPDFSFVAIDGLHEAHMRPEDLWVELKMSAVNKIKRTKDYTILDTGSPHYVTFVEDLDDIDIYANGRAIRYSSAHRDQGINVNFVQIEGADHIRVGTYERGVEDETFSCGTGVTAAALSYGLREELPSTPDRIEIRVETKGGLLAVRFRRIGEEEFEDIWLCGPATHVFDGEIKI